MQYQDVMIDLETLGTRPGCSILSIGAVAFNEEGVCEDGLHTIISRSSCREYGLAEDADTLAWWEKQSEEAKATLHQATEAGMSLPLALGELSGFLSKHGGLKNVRVWGNGANFDQPILNAAFVAIGQPAQSWRFYNDRCYRTLKALLDPLGKQFERVGTYHNAHADALSQALHAVKLLQMLRAPA